MRDVITLSRAFCKLFTLLIDSLNTLGLSQLILILIPHSPRDRVDMILEISVQNRTVLRVHLCVLDANQSLFLQPMKAFHYGLSRDSRCFRERRQRRITGMRFPILIRQQNDIDTELIRAQFECKELARDDNKTRSHSNIIKIRQQ